MPSAEIVTIGSEILLGEITDTNAPHIARVLRSIGVDVVRTTSVGDDAARIAAAVREAAARAAIVVATGGLGPTVDDPTRDAVALAAGVPTEFRPELWAQVQAVYRRYGNEPPDNNRRQAYVPAGAVAIENPVGTAPGFIATIGESAVVALPGVPREMEHLLERAVVPWLRGRFGLTDAIKVRILHTAGISESIIDDRVHDLEAQQNPSVGLAAHSGRVDVRITAKAAGQAEAETLVAAVEADLRARLGDWVYGADGETLADAALGHVATRGWRLAVVEAGLGGRLAAQLAASPAAPATLAGIEVLTADLDPEALAGRVAAVRAAWQADVGFGLVLYPDADRQVARFVLVTPEDTRSMERAHGGHPGLAARRVANLGLDWLRRA